MGRVQALSPTTFNIQSGEFFSIIGPSGCGKSTLLNLLAGLDEPSAGKVLVDGVEVKEPGPDRAVVFQEHGLMPWMTVRHNVEYGLKLAGMAPKDRQEKAMQYLRMVHLSKFAESYPHQLSGGMRQRVSIARALALEPRILLMDEPFSALDAQTRDVLQDELQRIWEETRTTILFVTHHLSEAVYLSDRVMIMTAPPGSIKRIVRVPFAHPRQKTSNELSAFINDLHQDIKTEVDIVAARELDPDWQPENAIRQEDGIVMQGEGI
ncbi:ATP-binding cassette domain-containing protein [bacterium]|nr:ATP-binding cassette domain-containing protein [bacterium]